MRCNKHDFLFLQDTYESGKQQADHASRQAQDAASAGKGKIRQATDAAADYASDTYESAKDTVNSGASYAQDAASVGKHKGKQAANDASRYAQDTADSASRTGKQAAGSAQQGYNQAADAVSKKGKQASGSAQQAYNDAAGTASDAASAGKHKGKQAAGGAAQYAQDTYKSAKDSAGELCLLKLGSTLTLCANSNVLYSLVLMVNSDVVLSGAGDAAQYVQDSAHDAADYASDAYDSAKETVKDAAEALSDYFTQYTTWAKKRTDETAQSTKDVTQVSVMCQSVASCSQMCLCMQAFYFWISCLPLEPVGCAVGCHVACRVSHALVQGHKSNGFAKECM